jgi:hypothetical protein
MLITSGIVPNSFMTLSPAALLSPSTAGEQSPSVNAGAGLPLFRSERNCQQDAGIPGRTPQDSVVHNSPPRILSADNHWRIQDHHA